MGRCNAECLGQMCVRQNGHYGAHTDETGVFVWGAIVDELFFGGPKLSDFADLDKPTPPREGGE